VKEISQSDTNCLFKGRQTFYIQHKEHSRRISGRKNSSQVEMRHLEYLRNLKNRETQRRTWDSKK